MRTADPHPRIATQAVRIGCAVAILLTLTAACGQRGPTRLSPPLPGEQIDLTQYVHDACPLLRPDRAQRRGLVPPGQPVARAGGTDCRWAPNGRGRPAISVRASTDRGLESVYRDRASYGTFDPTAIAHYPTALTTSKGRIPARTVYAPLRSGSATTTSSKSPPTTTAPPRKPQPTPASTRIPWPSRSSSKSAPETPDPGPAGCVRGSGTTTPGTG